MNKVILDITMLLGSIIVPLCYFENAFQAHIKAILRKSSINWFENSPALSTKAQSKCFKSP
jgi:hypothetical protein